MATQDAVQEHRRIVRRLVILPVAAGLGFIVLLVLSTIFLTPRQLTLVSNLMLTCMCLLPLVICLTPLYFGAIFAVYGMSRVNEVAYSQLERVRSLSAGLATRTAQTTDTLNRRALNTSANLARLDPLFDVFNQNDGETPNA